MIHLSPEKTKIKIRSLLVKRLGDFFEEGIALKNCKNHNTKLFGQKFEDTISGSFGATPIKGKGIFWPVFNGVFMRLQHNIDPGDFSLDLVFYDKNKKTPLGVIEVELASPTDHVGRSAVRYIDQIPAGVPVCLVSLMKSISKQKHQLLQKKVGHKFEVFDLSHGKSGKKYGGRDYFDKFGGRGINFEEVGRFVDFILPIFCKK